MITLIKEPAELLRERLTFGGVMTITSLTSIDVVSRSLVAGSQMVTVTPDLLAGALTIEISGGTHGERYDITIAVVDADSQPRVEMVALAVLEQGWEMPDGSPPMMSIKSFIARFGIDEVVRMTDETGNGQIGKPMLVAALVDAQALTTAHLAGRYALPLESVPPIIELTMADIARGRLYPHGAPEGVTANARAAVRTLERIQAGQLAFAGAVAAGSGMSDAPVLVYKGRRAYPDGLADF